MIIGLWGGPILEVARGEEIQWLPAWSAETVWGEEALHAGERRRVNVEQVILRLAREDAFYAVSGPVARYLRGMSGTRVEEGVGAYADLLLGCEAGALPSGRATIACIGWDRIVLVRVQDWEILEIRTLETVPGWHDVAAYLLRKAFLSHRIRWDILEAGWRAHCGSLPFEVDPNVLALEQNLIAAGVTHLAGLGRGMLGTSLPWLSEARGLVRYLSFLRRTGGA